jgi:hypothetical protein
MIPAAMVIQVPTFPPSSSPNSHSNALKMRTSRRPAPKCNNAHPYTEIPGSLQKALTPPVTASVTDELGRVMFDPINELALAK